MAFQPVPDVVEIDILYLLNGTLVQNVFYAEKLGGYDLGDLEAMADAIDAQVQGTWKAQQPTDAIYQRTEVRGLAEENDLTADSNFNTGPGVFVGQTLPNNVTFSVKKSSGFTGRSARGRTYWIGIPNTVLQGANENLVEQDWADDVEAAVDSIRSATGAVDGFEPVLVSRIANGVVRDFGVTFDWQSTTAVDLRVDTNRNRLPKL